jgi:DNA-binding transcriptional LysR family regulator
MALPTGPPARPARRRGCPDLASTGARPAGTPDCVEALSAIVEAGAYGSADRLAGLELRQIAAFQAVAEERSFSRAARRLGYSQSAISQQVAALEQMVGHRLLERRGGQRPTSLTPIGQIVLRHADAIISRVRATASDIAGLERGTSSDLRIGAYQGVSARILPELLRTYSRHCPQSKVRFVETPDDHVLLSGLERGELDLAIVTLPTPDGPFETVVLLRDPYVLLVAAGSPLAARACALSVADIAHLPLIAHTETKCQRRLEETLRAGGLEPNVLFRSDDNGTIQGLVVAGIGCAVVPQLAVVANDDRAATVDLADRIPPLVLGITRHRDRYESPAARAFVETAVCVARSIERSGAVGVSAKRAELRAPREQFHAP